MPLFHDNVANASQQPAAHPEDAEGSPVSPVLTAELALIEMLARLIVDTVQREATASAAENI